MDIVSLVVPSCSSHTRPTLSRGELLWCAPMLTPPPRFAGRRRIGASQSSPRVWCCSGGGVLGGGAVGLVCVLGWCRVRLGYVGSGTGLGPLVRKESTMSRSRHVPRHAVAGGSPSVGFVREQKARSLTFWLFFGGPVTLWIPTLIFHFSPRYFWKA